MLMFRAFVLGAMLFAASFLPLSVTARQAGRVPAATSKARAMVAAPRSSMEIEAVFAINGLHGAFAARRDRTQGARFALPELTLAHKKRR